MNPFDATAMGIFMFEGGNLAVPTTRNIRNNNPGNLRPYAKDQPTDGQNYRVFDTFDQGWGALVDDVTYKVRHHLTPTQTMVDLFEIYAPGADHNNPIGYAGFVIEWLTHALGKTVTLATTIGEIYG